MMVSPQKKTRDSDEQLTIGIDLGGTNIKAILVNRHGDILHEAGAETRDNPRDPDGSHWKKSIKEIVTNFLDKAPGSVSLAGVSAPGLANRENTGIAYLPNRLIGLEHFHWGEYLGLKTYVLNDAHAHLIAESRFGVGAGFQNIVLLTLGTGVGGGILIEGKLYQGEKGRAGHLGHTSISEDEGTSIVGTPGSLENAIGECTIEQRTYGRYMSTRELVEAYRRGETFASWVWIHSIQELARAMVSLINAFSPQLFILGGGITQAGDALLKPLNDFMDVYEWRPGGYKTPIKLAALGQYTGALGAAVFARISEKGKSK